MVINNYSSKFILLQLAYLVTAILIVALIYHPGLINERAGVINLTNFEGHKPFQYRIVVPLIVRGLDIVTPDIIKEKVDSLLEPKIANLKVESEVSDNKIELLSRYIYRSAVYICLNILSIFSFMVVFRRFSRLISGLPGIISDLLPLGLVAIIPVFYLFPNYCYDFSHLFLLTLAMYYMYKREWLKYIIVYFFAILNKETVVLLTLLFLIYNWSELPRPQLLKLAGIQFMIFAVIKGALFIIFRHNPGGFVEFHLQFNLKHLTKLANYVWFGIPPKGFLMPFPLNIPQPIGLNVICFAPVAFLVSYRWREKPLFLRQAMISLPILVFLTLFLGIIHELRDYYDVLPAVYILATIGLYRVYTNHFQH